MNQQEFLSNLQQRIKIQKKRLKYQNELKNQAESLFKTNLDKIYSNQSPSYNKQRGFSRINRLLFPY